MFQSDGSSKLPETKIFSAIAVENDSVFLSKVGNTYGWNHADYNPDEETDERVAVPVYSQSDEDTIAWLYKQVMPAMRRLIGTGVLDLAHFLERVYEE